MHHTVTPSVRTQRQAPRIHKRRLAAGSFTFTAALLLLMSDISSAQAPPPWTETGAPRRLSMHLEKLPGAGIAGRATEPADFHIRRAKEIAVDAEFDDWSNAEWITMSGKPYLFGDNFETTVELSIPVGDESADTADPGDYFGLMYDQVDQDLIDKYDIDEIYDARGAVVVTVKPESIAARAGIREGDVILKLGEQQIKWCYELHRDLTRLTQLEAPRTVPVLIKRNGRDNLGPPEDLSARFAFLVNDENLYFAAKVTDDVHFQNQTLPELWNNDGIQIGIDPTLVRHDDGYGADGHEIGLALQNGKPVFYRWFGRRGQDDKVKGMKLMVRRAGAQTLYEAAIPLLSLAPLSPDMWPHCGINVVVWDSDGSPTRETHLSLRHEVMTTGKQLDKFADFEFDPSDDKSKISMAWFWDYRLHPSGKFGLKVCLCSPTPTKIRLAARLGNPLEPRHEPSRAEVEIPVTDKPTEWRIRMMSRSQPMEYRVEWVAYDEDGNAIAHEGLPIYVGW